MKRMQQGHGHHRVRALGLGLALAAALLSLQATSSHAQDWPSRAVRIVVPFGAGGVTDTVARLFANKLSESLKQPVVVENRPGAGGVIGTEYVARSPADGYTLYLATAPQHYCLPLIHKLKYDPDKDLTPISIVGHNPMMLTVPKTLPVHSLAELVAYVKANPGKTNYSHGGVGTATHLAPAVFAARAQLDAVAIPSGSGPGTINDMLSGTTQFYLGQPVDILPNVASGQLRLLATSGERRSPHFPDVPTIAETYPGFAMVAWLAIYTPAGTPAPIVEKLRREVIAAARDPQIVDRLSKLGVEATGTDAKETAAEIEKGRAVYVEAVKAAGLLRKD